MSGSIAILKKESRGYGFDRDAGASLLFPPQYSDEQKARQAILHIIHREPSSFGFHCSRWKLALLRKHCSWLRLTTDSGMFQLLSRLGISYKRARHYVHSPDKHYDEKVALIQHYFAQARSDPERYVFLYQDELTYYRQPSLARDYEAQGHIQPLVRLSHRANNHRRVIGALNAFTGQVTYEQCSKVSLKRMSRFYAKVRETYPHAEVIYIAQDNWPIHFHPAVLANLQPQEFPYPPRFSPRWPFNPTARVGKEDGLPIHLLPLPTYASWLNPIEKLWRWLKQEVLHLHRLSDDWEKLKEAVSDFLDRFQNDSPQLLRYVGLLPV